MALSNDQTESNLNSLIRPTAVEPREGYRIWLRYEDGVAGEVDLSHLAGRGVFRAWLNRSHFETVHITPDGGVGWGGDIELCPDALYMQLTGMSFDEWMAQAERQGSHV